MKNIPIARLLKPMMRLLNRYNFSLFIVLVACGLIIAVVSLSNILISVYGGTTTPTDNPVPSSVFDQSVIDRLGKLETSTSNVNYKTLPAGRTDPFSE